MTGFSTGIYGSVGVRFATVAARLPAKTAIESDGSNISYADLDFASDVIARRLRAGKSRPPARVALLFNDRIAAITAMLGVLKAGDAYVLLDADDPDERVQFILRDCAPLALVTDSDHLERAQTLVSKGCRLVNIIDQPEPDIMPGPLPEVAPDAMAYIYYTSGSTGLPKGVCHTHRNQLYYVECYKESLAIREDDRFSMLYSLNFSAANFHIYGGLLSGASVHAYDVRRNGIPPLAAWIEDAGITVLHTVPTVFRHLVDNLDQSHRFDRIRAVYLGGEMAFASDVAMFRRHFRNDCRFTNRLAATELMLMAEYVVDPANSCDGVNILPVGRSPDGVRLHIQRLDGTESNSGEVGEIVVTSPYISSGYWQRPELNAAVFSDDPEKPGWRIFRTGDLGRIGADCSLHFLGRNGTRVKIRGQSVDLAEVEAGLRQCKCVLDVAVTAEHSGDQQEADRLVAYVVVRLEADCDPRRIRRELAQRLPLYMLPTGYVFLDALPLTVTGKVDKKALHRPDLSGRQNDDYQPPLDDLERGIAAIYQRVLKYSPVGRTDDFFLMGGDSLSVVELKSLLADLFGHNIPDVFEDATVAGVAESNRHLLTRTSSEEQLMPVLVPLRKDGDGPVLFLVHGRLGQAHISPHFLDLLGRDQPVYSIQARGVDGIQMPNETIEAMAQDYATALREAQPHGPYFIGGFCAGGYVALEMANLLQESGEQVFPLLLIDPPLPFFSEQAVEVQIQTLSNRIRKHSTRGDIDFDLEDPQRWKGASRVAASFENALIKFRPTPYAGPVFLLANTDRLLSPNGWENPSTLDRVFSGKVYSFEVGKSHGQILDVRNEKFVRSLTCCIKSVRTSTVEDFNSNFMPDLNQSGTPQAGREPKPEAPAPARASWQYSSGRAPKWF